MRTRVPGTDLFQRFEDNTVDGAGFIFRQVPVKRFVDFANVGAAVDNHRAVVKRGHFSAVVGDMEVVKSPTISSRISSTVTSP